MKSALLQPAATFLTVCILCLSGDSVLAQISIGESNSGLLTSLPPLAPELVSPVVDSVRMQNTVSFIWNSRIHSVSYRLHVASNPGFSSLILDQPGLPDTVYTASGLLPGETYYWRVSAANVAGEGEFSETESFTMYSILNVNSRIIETPDHCALLPANPNPFSSKTRIAYQLSERTEVRLVIYNLLGKSVKILDSGVKPAGLYSNDWNGDDAYGKPVRDGVYLCCLRTEGRIFTQKIFLMH